MRPRPGSPDPFVWFRTVRAAYELWLRVVPRKWMLRLLALSSAVALILVVRDSL